MAVLRTRLRWLSFAAILLVLVSLSARSLEPRAASAAVPPLPTSQVSGGATPVGTAPAPTPALPSDAITPVDQVSVAQPLPVTSGQVVTKLQPVTSSIKGFDAVTSKLDLAKSSPTGNYFDNADGTHTLDAYSEAVNFRDATGALKPIDTTLQLGAGRWAARSTKQATSFGLLADDPQLARLLLPSGASIAFGVAGAPASPGAVSGSVATYALAGGVQLKLAAGAGGVHQSLVLPSQATAPTSFDFPLVLGGLTATVDKSGSTVQLTDTAGVLRATIPAGSMDDSDIDPDLGLPAHSDGVTYSLTGSGPNVTLHVALDAAWLKDPARVFPVTVDPDFGATGVVDASDDTFVQNGFNSHNPSLTELRVGSPGDNGVHTAFSYIHFPAIDSSLTNAYIVNATLNLYQVHSWTCGTFPTYVYRVTQPWDGNAIEPGPGWSFDPYVYGTIATDHAHSPDCNTPGVDSMNVTQLVYDWTHRTPNYGITVRAASGSDNLYWKIFASWDAAADHGSAPHIGVTWANLHAQYGVGGAFTTPVTPTSNGSIPVTLTNDGSTAWPAGGAIHLAYHLYDGAGNIIPNGTVINGVAVNGYDGVRTVLPVTVPSGGQTTVQATVGALPTGNYILRFEMVYDGVSWFADSGDPSDRSNPPTGFPVSNAAPQFTSTPTGPVNGGLWTSLRPTFTAAATDPDNYPAGATLTYDFRLCGNAAMTGTCVDSGATAASTFTPPAGALAWNSPYYWTVTVSDTQASTVSVQQSFRIVPAQLGDAAHFGEDPYGPTYDGVNPQIGSLVVSGTEAQVPVPGPALEVARTYNSKDTAAGTGRAFGTGWSSLLDLKVKTDADGNAIVTSSTGREDFFGLNGDGSFSAFGSTKRLVHNGSGWLYSQPDGASYAFDTTGKLGTVTDQKGLTQAVGRDGSGRVATLTDTKSGRKLTFGYNTANHVTSVDAGPATSGGSHLIWTYSYSGDLLTGVCSARKATETTLGCTGYTYDATPRLKGVTNPDRSTATTPNRGFAYDASGRVGTVTVVSNTADAVGLTKTWTYDTDPTSGLPRTTMTQPHSATVTTRFVYDGLGRLVQHSNSVTGARTFSYDASTGAQNGITDENGVTTAMTVDGRGNVTSRAVPRLPVVTSPLQPQTTVDTRYATYFYNAAAPTDPRTDKPLLTCYGRSGGTSDPSRCTQYSYDATTGELLTTVTPGPSGGTATSTYTAGTETAVGSTGTQPSRLLKTGTTAAGEVTSYAYDSAGDLTQQTDPSGLVTKYTYDLLGRQLTATTFPDDAPPAGLLTTTTYNADSLPVTITHPTSSEPDGTTRQPKDTLTYDADGNQTSVSAADLSAVDATRTVSVTLDNHDDVATSTDGAGKVTHYSHDVFDNTTDVTDPTGVHTQQVFDDANRLISKKVTNFVDDPINPNGGTTRAVTTYQATYLPTGQLVDSYDALGRKTHRDYYRNGQLQAQTLTAGSTTYQLMSNTVDATGNVTCQATNNSHDIVIADYDLSNHVLDQTTDPALGASCGATAGTVNATTTNTWGAGGRLTHSTTAGNAGGGTPTSDITYTYDGAGNIKTRSQAATATKNLITAYKYDNRNLQTAVTSPRGYNGGTPDPAYTTSYAYDAAGHQTTITQPSVTSQPDGVTNVVGSPITKTVYDTFGEIAATIDPRGAATKASHDKNGRVTGHTYPTYTPADGSGAFTATDTTTYDDRGQVLTHVDQLGNQYDFVHDALGRLTKQTDPAPTAGGTRGVVQWGYDDVGNAIATTDRLGAQSTYSYDGLDHQTSTNQKVRAVGLEPAATFTTTYTSDVDGDLLTRQLSSGATTTNTYDGADELRSSQDANGHTTAQAYDASGRATLTTSSLGRTLTATYDEAGRKLSAVTKSSTGTVVDTQAFTYDDDGNTITHTPNGGSTETEIWAYDSLQRLTSHVQPLTGTTSATTTFGYDQDGNTTRVTNPNGSPTTTTYTPLNLPEKITEPSTTQFPNLADRQWVDTYDAANDLVKEQQPGGQVVTHLYDNLLHQYKITGTQTGLVTTNLTTALDLNGQVVSAGHPTGATGITYTYDDRGYVVGQGGGTGTVQAVYNGDGELTSRQDSTGTSTFTYWPAGQLKTAAEPLTSTTVSYGYDDDERRTTSTYGSTTPAVQTVTYDDTDKVLTSTLVNGSTAAVLDSTTNTYDSDHRLKTSTLGPTGSAGAGTNTYGYDLAGRLTSWTNPASATTSYTWDANGNRLTAGGVTSTYNARNMLLTTGSTSYTYSAVGERLSKVAGGTTTSYVYDAAGRMTTGAGVTYSYDAFGRIAKVGTSAYLGYDGRAGQPVKDQTGAVSRGPEDEPLGTNTGPTPSLLEPNAHGDVISRITPAGGGSLDERRVYDPFGTVTTNTAATLTPLAGYQSSYTDRTTSLQKTDTRWLDNTTGSFLTRDATSLDPTSGDNLNRYTYAGADPLDASDTTGRTESGDGGGDSTLGFPSGNGGEAGSEPASSAGWERETSEQAALEARENAIALRDEAIRKTEEYKEREAEAEREYAERDLEEEAQQELKRSEHAFEEALDETSRATGNTGRTQPTTGLTTRSTPRTTSTSLGAAPGSSGPAYLAPAPPVFDTTFTPTEINPDYTNTPLEITNGPTALTPSQPTLTTTTPAVEAPEPVAAPAPAAPTLPNGESIPTEAEGGGAGQSLFRADTRGPDEIFSQGFEPKGDNMDLWSHVNQNPEDSGFVSTTKHLSAAQDFADEVGADYVYRLRATGVDVNATLGESSPFPWEHEVAVPGGVPPSAIEGVFGPQSWLDNPLFGP
jgi:RHS repeat-associated protein